MNNTKDSGKLLATISYITPIGLIIAITMNLEKRNPFVFFHARQMIGLILCVGFSNLCDKYINPTLGLSLWCVTFLLWLYALFTAITGTQKPIPILGKYFQQWFKSLK